MHRHATERRQDAVTAASARHAQGGNDAGYDTIGSGDLSRQPAKS